MNILKVLGEDKSDNSIPVASDFSVGGDFFDDQKEPSAPIDPSLVLSQPQITVTDYMVCDLYVKSRLQNGQSAKNQLNALADHGNHLAEGLYGHLCFMGSVYELQNKLKATFYVGRSFHWLQEESGRGNSFAQMVLGLAFYDGTVGGEVNHTESVKWTKLAANQGIVVAQLHLSICYALGHGVSVDKQEAEKWCLLAAKNGYPIAQHVLGEYHTFCVYCCIEDELQLDVHFLNRVKV